jgi:hypothetical protein
MEFFYLCSAETGLNTNYYIAGEVAEWSKAHAWKVCIPQKGIVGSNPTFSA